MARLFLPCAAGVEAWLLDEVQALCPQAEARAERGGVSLHGTRQDAMRLNLESRLAQRVLCELAHGPYADETAIYELARTVAWPAWITARQTLKVDVTATRSPLRSLNFAALRVKDAVCDTMREDCGERPSVDTYRPDLPLVLHLDAEFATLYVDTSGAPLFKRGWREDKGEAPLKETLAAAMLAAAGWQGRAEDGPLLDPCCGAGTLAIEAAQMACGVAPGLQRRFAFERLRPFQDVLPEWQRLREAARARVHAPTVAVFAGDIAFRMTDFAQRNAERAGVAHAIHFKTADATQRPPPVTGGGTMIFNPPYGERIEVKGQAATRRGRERFEAAPGPAGPAPARSADEDAGAAEAFFRALAAHWKRHYDGWTAWILSPDMKLPGALRLQAGRRVPMWNGPIECRLFRFDLQAGAGPGRPAAEEGADSDGPAGD